MLKAVLADYRIVGFPSTRALCMDADMRSLLSSLTGAVVPENVPLEPWTETQS
jgi:hypothetical protein